jgi:predicted DNA-binding transcriptional regulator AlpA
MRRALAQPEDSVTSRRHQVCPPPTSRGLNRQGAADYVGVSPSLFDQMVADGRMPKPKRINARTVWDVRKLDIAFDALPGDEQADEGNEWAVEA